MHSSCTAVRHGRRRNGTAFTLRTSQYCNPPTESSCNEKTSVVHYGCPGFSSSRSSEMLLQVLRALHEVLSFTEYNCIPHSSRRGKQRKRLYLPTPPAADDSACAGVFERVRGTFCTRMNGYRSTALVSVAAITSLDHTFFPASTVFTLTIWISDISACHSMYLFGLVSYSLDFCIIAHCDCKQPYLPSPLCCLSSMCGFWFVMPCVAVFCIKPQS